MPVRKVRSALDVELIEMPRIQRSFGAGLLGCLGFPSARRWKPCSFRSSPLLWPGMSDRRAECGGSLLRCWLPPGRGGRAAWGPRPPGRPQRERESETELDFRGLLDRHPSWLLALSLWPAASAMGARGIPQAPRVNRSRCASTAAESAPIGLDSSYRSLLKASSA
jgi:hypothetical protein